MSNLLDNLNDKQKEAVTHFKGPLLVVAGAGSGKTSALTHRIAYLIKERGVSPWNILAVTFTNKAANEMKERVVKLLTDESTQALMEGFEGMFEPGQLLDDKNIPTIGTFHSVCVRILRKQIHNLDYENSFVIYDYADQQILVKRIMQDMAIDPKKINPKAVLSHISNAKNQLMRPEDYMQYSSSQFSDKVGQIYPRYQAELAKNNALDFDDIIMKTVELFTQFPEVLDFYQEKFKFIAIDEYQDTNKAQYELIRLLAQKYQNLCVIGDSDQSIYSWRGATIQNILDFEKDYPDAKVVKLEQNYRSTQVILDAAHSVIEKNMQRQDKRLWTDKDGGDKIRHWLADNERHEGQMIVAEMSKQLMGSECPAFKDFVVLYRTNAQSRVLEEIFLGRGIPYKIVGGIKFYERKEIKDILAYLRVVANPNDSVSLLRIINTPSRKIGAKTIDLLRNFALRNNLSIFNAMLLADEIEGMGSKANAIEDFVKIIKDIQDANTEFSASGMIKMVLEKSGYKKMLNDGSVEGEARLENIYELISVAAKYDNIEAGLSLNIFLEEISLISDVDTMDETDNAVTFMTIHSAKGLEFPNVFIVGLEEGIFPHNRSLMDRSELEEERRLMYVAMTRAKENLYLLHSRRRMHYGETKSNAPSQFLADIQEELVESNMVGVHGVRKHINVSEIGNTPIPVELDETVDCDLEAGDRVQHNAFGQGIIVDITGGVATVAFEDAKVGVKKLALSVAPLKKI